MSKMKMLLPFVIVYVIVALLVHVLKNMKNKTAPQYDERQLLVRGNAYKYGFFTLLSYYVGIGVLSVIMERDFATTYAYAGIGLCLGLIVFVTYSLFKDAYIGIKDNMSLSIGCSFLAGFCNAGPSLSNMDRMLVGGILQNTFVQLLLGVTFIYIGIILIVKKQMNKREI